VRGPAKDPCAATPSTSPAARSRSTCSGLHPGVGGGRTRRSLCAGPGDSPDTMSESCSAARGLGGATPDLLESPNGGSRGERKTLRAPYLARNHVATDEQKSRTSASNRAGCSRLLTCPTPAMTASRAPGIASSIWCATVIGDRASASPQIKRTGTWMFERRSRVSACANAVAISRNPTGWKSNMMRANSSRASCGGDSPNIPGRYLGTNSLGGSEASRRQAARRSSGTGSGSEPLDC
jgi:hypothetical protein